MYGSNTKIKGGVPSRQTLEALLHSTAKRWLTLDWTPQLRPWVA
jgi:hypothetical protein